MVLVFGVGRCAPSAHPVSCLFLEALVSLKERFSQSRQK